MKNKELDLLLLNAYKKKGMQNRRMDNDIHVSNLKNFCPREFALCLKNNIIYNHRDSISAREYWMYELGHLVHSSISSILKSEGVLYKSEHRLRLNEYGFPIVGSCDNLLSVNSWGKELIVHEVKSIGNADTFDKMTEPFIDDQIQLSLYMWLLKKAGGKVTLGHVVPAITRPVNTKQGIVTYCCKVMRPKPFKSFLVDIMNPYIKTTIKKLKEVKTFSDNRRKMPKRICNSPLARMARRPCRTVFQCFPKHQKKGGIQWP